jgi:hypothetical protein
VVEGASLESLYMGNCIVGSNPILSAILNPQEIQFCNSWGFIICKIFIKKPLKIQFYNQKVSFFLFFWTILMYFITDAMGINLFL